MWPCIVECIWDLWSFNRGLHVANRWRHCDLLLLLSHTVSPGNPDSGRPLSTSPNKNMSLNYSINTHRDAWSSKLITQLSFLSIKHRLPSALPSVNLLNNLCHLWLSRGTSSHATHRVTFQSTPQHLPEVKISHWSCVSFLWLKLRSQTFQTNVRADLRSAEHWRNLIVVVWIASFLPIACVICLNCVWQLFNGTNRDQPFAEICGLCSLQFFSVLYLLSF